MTELTEKINTINQFIREKKWFDFELIGLENKTLKIIGSTDFTYFHEIEILFHEIFYVQCPDNWKSDTEQDVILIPGLDEQRKLNMAYEVEQGHTLVKFIAEDKGPIYISCKDVTYYIETKRYNP